jgi:hypothetical protein
LASQAPLAVIPLDRDTLAYSRADLADIRVASGTDEQPYVLREASERIEETVVPVRLVNRVYLPDIGVQAVLELSAAAHHNRARLETNEKNFRSTVLVETSEDGRHWNQIRSGEIYDVSTSARQIANLAVDYPDATSRYLRLTVVAWKEVTWFAGAVVSACRKSPARRTELGSFTVRGQGDPDTRSTVYLLDFGITNLPVDRLEFDVGAGYFHREVDVESSADQKEWRTLTRSLVSRLPGEESSAVVFSPSRQRFLRVRLFHGDDNPLDVRRITATCVEREVTIQPKSAAERWLYYGRPDATAPQYDLGVVLERAVSSVPARASLGVQQANPAYESTSSKPWTERHPTVIYTVLGLAVLGLIVVALRLLAQFQDR